jgi:hypothetical protein
MASVMKVIVGSEGSRCHHDGGLGLRVLGASHVGHARDRAQGGARGWCKSRGLEVIRHDIRCEGKRRG